MINRFLAPHSYKFSFFLVYIFIIFFLTISFAQTPNPTVTPTPSEDDNIVRISTTLIQIDVTVTDKKGKIVTDLKPEDFEVYENGKKQTITNFSFIFNTSEKITIGEKTTLDKKNELKKPMPPVQLKPEEVRRTIALVIDDSGLSFESIHFIKRALKKFVDEQMQPNDLVAIIRTSGGMGALQQFTSDKNLLYSIIENISWRPDRRNIIRPFDALEPEQRSQNNQTNNQNNDRIISQEQQRTSLYDEFNQNAQSTFILRSIDFIIEGLNELPGRKSIMLFSDGFELCSPSLERPEGCGPRMKAFRKTVDAANRAAVTIYTQNSTGLQTTGIEAKDRIDVSQADYNSFLIKNLRDQSMFIQTNQEGLKFLAEETGGRSIVNNNNLNLGLEKLLEDQKGFYLLAYQPEIESFDSQQLKFNKLEVRLKNKEFDVKTRSGFLGVANSEITQKSFTQNLYRAISSPFKANQIRVKLNTLFLKDSQSLPALQSILHVEAKDLKFIDTDDGSKSATFDVLALILGSNGGIVDEIRKNYTLTVKDEMYKRILERGFVYDFTFPVKNSGAYQMRIGVRDSANQNLGSANQFIEIPDMKKNNLILSDITLENLNLNQWNHLLDNPASTYIERQTNPIQDTSLRRFKRNTVLRYSNEIYNAKLDKNQKPNLNTKIIVFRDNKIVFEGSMLDFDIDEQPDMKRLKLTGAISLGTELVPGDYILQIIVIDNLAKEKEKLSDQWIQFEITE